MHLLRRLYTALHPHHIAIIETALQLLFIFVIFTSQASAVIRFTNRSLFMFNTAPNAVTKYQVSFTYTTPTTIGSVDMLFCENPIPDLPCVPPPGLDVSHAVLSEQHGVTGYSIGAHSANHLVLTRTPDVVNSVASSYTLSNVVNPTDTSVSFAIRLNDYASADATGSIVDLGSVLSAVNASVNIETQVPPTLTFCAARKVSQDCSDISGDNYTDMGALSPSHTLTATSQMAAGTNASRGYAIAVYGPPLEAGTNVIDAPSVPTVSKAGVAQFGINLRANSLPNVGSDPDGSFTNANPAAGYGIPNKFMYRDGDIVAVAPNVSLVRRFTVSYIVNVPANQRAGVYTTTFTYVCTGRF